MEQNVASVGMYLLADKYDIPCLSAFARRSLQTSMSLSTADGEDDIPFTHVLDPWQIAAYGSQCNDAELVDFCMNLVVAPLKHGKNMLAPSTPPTVPALLQILIEKTNTISRYINSVANKSENT